MAKKNTNTKTLIEKSIEIYGMGHPEVKTVFNIENESDRQNPLFRDLTRISGRTLTVWFSYTENEVTVPSKMQMSIPKDLDESAVKAYILGAINETLN